MNVVECLVVVSFEQDIDKNPKGERERGREAENFFFFQSVTHKKQRDRRERSKSSKERVEISDKKNEKGESECLK